MPQPTHYANKIDVTVTTTEVILDCKLAVRTSGRPAEQVRLVLPHDVAAKLGAILTAKKEGDDETQPNDP